MFNDAVSIDVQVRGVVGGEGENAEGTALVQMYHLNTLRV